MIYLSISIVGIMVCFAIFGLVDHTLLKDRFSIGNEFIKGIEMIGPVCLAIIGIITLVPTFSIAIQNSIGKLYANIYLDPSMAVSTILAIDMGGWQLANAVASNATVGQWAGAVYGSMMGATIVFSIPVGFSSIRKEDNGAFSKGILFGLAAIPFGSFVGGLIMGIPVTTVLLNLVPPIVFSIIIILAIIFFPNGTIKVFKVFSLIITIVGMVGLAIGMVLDFIVIPILDANSVSIETIRKYFAPITDGIITGGNVGLILSGALPFVFVLNKLLKKPLTQVSQKTGFSTDGILGFLTSCANNMATFAMLKDMKEREKVVNVAFAVCAAFIIGDHLAFCAGNCPNCIVPMMVAKLTSGVIAVVIALLFTRNLKENGTQQIIEEN